MPALIPVARPSTSAVALSDFAEHLRLSCSFGADVDAAGEAEIAPYLAAATAAVERRAGLGLITQTWMWRVSAWPRRRGGGIELPFGPVSAVDSVTVYDSSGAPEVWNAAEWGLDPAQDRLVALSAVWPHIDHGGWAEVIFDIGYGPAPEDIPDDLRHAVLLIAAHYYENRAAAGDSLNTIPFGAATLLEPYRRVRLS